MRRISYRPAALSRISSQEVRELTAERTTPLPTLSHPRLPRSTAVREITDVESWAAPVIGIPALDFAAPLTFSLAQPSRPVEIRLGDFGESISAPGSPHPGHGTRNGFMESGFGNGYGGQKHIDRQPVRIVWKPKPEYTEEARSKKIQGDVIIDLIFTTQCQVVIGRIVQTLGYGLDETAVQAVSKIVFRPATENGRAIDFEARARVEFRLIPNVQILDDETQ
jgi:TonB family protein